MPPGPLVRRDRPGARDGRHVGGVALALRPEAEEAVGGCQQRLSRADAEQRVQAVLQHVSGEIVRGNDHFAFAEEDHAPVFGAHAGVDVVAG